MMQVLEMNFEKIIIVQRLFFLLRIQRSLKSSEVVRECTLKRIKCHPFTVNKRKAGRASNKETKFCFLSFRL